VRSDEHDDDGEYEQNDEWLKEQKW
jgi:hypothetical protein